jgi:hypothetical protein
VQTEDPVALSELHVYWADLPHMCVVPVVDDREIAEALSQGIKILCVERRGSEVEADMITRRESPPELQLAHLSPRSIHQV